jgi:hypothetical protein
MFLKRATLGVLGLVRTKVQRMQGVTAEHEGGLVTRIGLHGILGIEEGAAFVTAPTERDARAIKVTGIRSQCSSTSCVKSWPRLWRRNRGV